MAQDDQPPVTPGEIDKHLDRINYPARKQSLKEQAQEKNVPSKILAMIDQLPDEQYSSADDVATTYSKVK